MRTFYEQRWEDRFKETVFYSPVAGDPVRFPGFDGIDFFIHEAHDHYFHWYPIDDVSYWWDVHEAKTGMLVATGDSREEAYQNAKERLSTKTAAEVVLQINNMRKKYGTSPLYRRQQ